MKIDFIGVFESILSEEETTIANTGFTSVVSPSILYLHLLGAVIYSANRYESTNKNDK